MNDQATNEPDYTNDRPGASHGVASTRNINYGHVQDGSNIYQGENFHIYQYPSEEPTTPRQCHAVPDDCVNHTDQLTDLDRWIDDAAASAKAAFAVLYGGDGLGKTVLAGRWEFPNRGRFPDGTIYCDFTKYTVDGTVNLLDALGELMNSCGDDSRQWTNTVDGRGKRWRSIITDKRCLIILDNLEDPALLHELLPNDPHPAFIAITRYNLLEFAMAGATPIQLEKLNETHSRELLAAFCEESRLAADEAETAALVRRCDGRPRLLRMAGASLQLTPGLSLAEFNRQLSAIDDSSPIHIRQVAEAIVAHALAHTISEPQRQLLRPLATYAGRDFSADLANWLVVGDASRLLDGLEAAQLITRTGKKRWRVVDAVREHDFGDENTDTEHIYDWYLISARLCDIAVLGEKRMRVCEIDTMDTDSPLAPESAKAATAWFYAEQHNLFALQRDAFDRGKYATVCALEEALWVLYDSYRPLDSWAQTSVLALEAAHRLGEPIIESRMRAQHGKLLRLTGDTAGARREIDLAIELAVQSGNWRVEASAVEFLGIWHRENGDYLEAIEHFAAALRKNDQHKHLRGAALQRRLIGECYLQLGQYGLAARYLGWALEEFRREVSPSHEARTLVSLAFLSAHTDSPQDVSAALNRAHGELLRTGLTGRIAPAYTEVADALAARGLDSPARGYWKEALEFYEENHGGDSDAAVALRRKLEYTTD